MNIKIDTHRSKQIMKYLEDIISLQYFHQRRNIVTLPLKKLETKMIRRETG